MKGMNRMAAALASAILMAVPAVAGVMGDWHGTLDAGAAKLRLVFHISADGATMDSPDQGALGIPATLQYCSADSVAMEIASINFSYSGRIVDGRLDGTLRQFGRSFPLTLEPGDFGRPARPQTPEEPLPYEVREMTFENTGALPATLSGTLTLPDAPKDRPVVVMVTGSGLQDRDETLFEHRPFAVIADALARGGYSTLRYDDRSVGKSTGDAVHATTADNAADAAAAVRTLRDLGYSRVGILGHSEGGAIAFINAARGDADFIITLGAPGVRGDSIIVEQVNHMAPGTGMTVDAYRAAAPWKGNAWLTYFVDYDPSADISATQVPALILAGEKDRQVFPETNITAIRRLLPAGPKNEIHVYPGLNHLMQPCVTGNPDEYGRIETTIDEAVMADIISWLKRL